MEKKHLDFSLLMSGWTLHMLEVGRKRPSDVSETGGDLAAAVVAHWVACDTTTSRFPGFLRSRRSIFQQLVSRVSSGCFLGLKNVFSSGGNHFCPPASENIKWRAQNFWEPADSLWVLAASSLKPLLDCGWVLNCCVWLEQHSLPAEWRIFQMSRASRNKQISLF